MPIAPCLADRRPRPGFTLVELLVALLLFDCALLALAADAALLIRARGVARRREAAVSAALATVARIRATACSPPGVGSVQVGPGISERWAVTAPGASVRLVTDSVAYEGLTRESTYVLRVAVLC